MYKKKLNYTVTAPTSFSTSGFAKGFYLNKKDTTEPLKVTFDNLELLTKPEYLTVEKPSWFRFDSYDLPPSVSEMFITVEKNLRKDYPNLLWKSYDEPLPINWPKIAAGLAIMEMNLNGQDRFATIEEVLQLFGKDGVLPTQQMTLLFKPWLKEEKNIIRAGICVQLVYLKIKVSQEVSGM